ncbi:Primase, C-terminal 2 [uncultured Caudovirales phage]|uniref:Primase, C-terminal 2 n=1 Tax=uncultured Caudovirales phage TaxID=2100421 RepID=A0A6J5PCN3_9CAUD|nr:Primase, C-terminal 2 [uncultured Caudovirales phage]CAB4167666.1 Primase, C-terminal 2 [uncultured Caudovirales phage]
MGNVQPITPHNTSVLAPAELRELQGWLIWRFEQDPDNPNGKPLKVPYYADGGKRHGKQGGIDDRGRMTTFAAARDAAARRGFTGIGLALMPEFGITALDFDNCVDAQGKLPPEIEQIASQTYAEYSPSGMGVRAFVRGSYGNRKSPSEGNPYGFEVFTSNGFVTFTGNAMPYTDLLGLEDTIADLDALVAPLCAARFPATQQRVADPDDFMVGREPKIGLSISQMEELLSVLDADMPREDWIRVGMALHHECDGDDTGFDMWNDWSAQGSKYPSEEGLRTQWDSFERRKGSGHRQVTMASVIKMAKEAGASSTPRPTLAATVDDLRTAMSAVAATPALGMFTPEEYTGRFPITSLAVSIMMEPGGWLIKNVLPDAGLIVLFGASGSGKTFVAIDMAYAIAMGIHWRGNRTKKGRVLIIAAEGGKGMSKRLKAYLKHHKIDPADVDIGLLTVPPNFLLSEDVTELAAAVAASGGADVIIVDTMAQVTPGANENSSEDVGLALANARALETATGATILMVDHSGKDASKGVRGWSGKRAAADAELEVLKYENGTRELRITKMKDGDDGLKWGFRLETIVVGMDADGDPITSCVAVEADVPVPVVQETGPKAQRFGPHERHVLEIIEDQYAGVERAPLAELFDKCFAAMTKPEAPKRDLRRRDLDRAIQSLAKRKDPLIEIKNGHVIFCI